MQRWIPYAQSGNESEVLRRFVATKSSEYANGYAEESEVLNVIADVSASASASANESEGKGKRVSGALHKMMTPRQNKRNASGYVDRRRARPHGQREKH